MATVSDVNHISAGVEENEGATVTGLVAGIMNDAQTLIRQQFAMFRSEISNDLQKTAQASKLVGIGAWAFSMGLLLVSVGLVFFLYWSIGEWPLWACWMAVGAPIVLAGIASVVAGWSRMRNINHLPEKSLAALQENMSWITNRRS